ncbi:MAG: phospho-sugar mutase [Oscillospiraceae bacterium]|nr:phospho-sugar mutase [Oscillospiraceae bacterium]
MSIEMKLYNEWLENAAEDADLRAELTECQGNNEQIRDRFYRELEFGTGGIRGVIGAGTNRMNIYTVRKATAGLCDYLLETNPDSSVAIGYDSRIKSELFAREAARVLAAKGIRVHLYPELMPTPCLSFAVRYLKCDAGIMVTASHNPAKYNGYKCYGSDGCQMTDLSAGMVLDKIGRLDMFSVKAADFDTALSSGMIRYIGDDVVSAYKKEVKSQSIYPDAISNSGLKLVFTPLNGTGNKPVREVLAEMGAKNVTVVKEQEHPDGNFPTCPFPNPEIKEALRLGLEQSAAIGADLLLATDPDCDRVGIAVKDGDEYSLLSGNEVGALLIDYICSQRVKNGTMPKDPIAVKTIVSTNLAAAIAEKYGVRMINVLTGFKYIGEQIKLLEEQGREDRYIFGFEESYGYLKGTYARDKDAVVSAMMITEMACFYHAQGKSLIDVMDSLYDQYGYFLHTQSSFQCEGESGMQKMKEIMLGLQNNPPSAIGGYRVLKMADYKESRLTDIASGQVTVIDLPKSDVIVYSLEGESEVVIRPSGTEPKIKAYYTAISDTKTGAEEVFEKIRDDFTKVLGL